MGRNLIALVGVSAALVGCPEYTFPERADRVWGEPNPAEPENVVQTDRLLQVVEPTVDVLFVVDNSGSMGDDREALAENFPLFLEPFLEAEADWHVGVITTDPMHGGKLTERQGYRWVDADTPDPVGVFTEMATTARASLTGVEMGRQMAWEALSEQADLANAGFRREGAYLHITVLSDEDDDSMGAANGGISRNAFVEFVDTLVEPRRNTFNSIVAFRDDYPEERGDKYMDLTDSLGGLVIDVKNSNWGQMMGDLGGLQAPPPTEEFFLSAIPVPETIEVLVIWQGVTWIYVPGVDYEWNPVRNSIVFLQGMPPENSAVEVTYTVAAAVVE